MILLVAFAFLAGIITVLSPCILPVLPIILSSTIGDKNIGKSRPLGVVFGFILSFTFFTLFLSSLVRLSGIPAETLRFFSIFVIAVFGFSLLIPQFQLLMEKLFSQLTGFLPNNQNKTGFFGGLFIGFSLGLLWTPCVGPILASVISLAITGTVTFDSFIITLAYSLGTSIPMFLIMLGGQNLLKRVPWLVSSLGTIQKVFGGIMILTALGIFLNIDRKFQTFILETFPNYGSGLIQFEDNQLVRDQLDKKSSLNDLLQPKAPEIIVGGEWFNSEPFTLEKLRGKVVIVDFWTYSCINCQRTFPYLRSWNEKYKNKGLVIIGVHAPEFEFEKNPQNVVKALRDFQITYPVFQDNNFATWKAYNNRYWPAKYFIDKNGTIRYSHFGEGGYDESEKMIQELLKETGVSDLPSEINNPTYKVNAKTHETYLGYARIENFASPEQIQPDKIASYSLPKDIGNNEFSYQGNWFVSKEYANPQKDAQLVFNFDAKEVFLVMRNKGEASKVKVFLDDGTQYLGEDVLDGRVTVNEDKLYKLILLPAAGKHTLRLEFEDDNVEVYAFTFG